jgi:DHA1 family bicyclomycin/chloramphenicol resistance-like MFS transporter
VLASIAGAAPVLAPVLGAQLLRVTDWRGVFLVLAGIGALVVAAAFRWLPETLPGEHCAAGGLRTTLGNARVLLGRWSFSTAILAQGLGFGALFTYISTSSFVLQSGFGVTAQQFGLAFAANGVGIVLAGQFSRVLVGRLGSGALLRAGLLAQVLAGAALLGAAVAGWGLPVVLPAFFVVAFGAGLLMPNATAMAMAEAGRPMAGTASALVGVVQFAIGAVGAPLAGLGTTGALLPTALVVLGFAVLGSVAALGTARAPRHEPVPVLDGVPGPAT